jgi:ABC-type lipoprotein export system ATPase subunit
MRLGIGTVKGKWVNVHLLVSPEDPENISQVKRLLARLSFIAHDDSFCCSREDLIRLGRSHDNSLTDPVTALEHGSEQFKVSLDQLRQIYSASAWAQENILIAVAGSETDGGGGLRDAADATLRQEIEKFAHLIFASSQAQREFWLGRRSASENELRARYGGLKPCLHGSDAHELGTVGIPNQDRYSWLKGAIAFDTLRQACIDPSGRAFVGHEPPIQATPSQVIERIHISNAPWAKTPTVDLNPGLIAIIGARGSGKTALADMIAHGCDATSERLSEASFLTRARELLDGASISLSWDAGERTERFLDGSGRWDAAEYPRARYLSQQFVEELCSAHGMTDALMREMERVIFEAHRLSERDGAVDFQELLELRAARLRAARTRQEEALLELSERIGIELEKDKLVEGLKKQIEEKGRLIAGYAEDRDKLVTKGSEARLQRLAALTTAAEKVRGYLRYFSSQEQSLLSLKDEVASFRSYQAPEILRRSQEKYKSAALKDEQWAHFLLDYKGDVDASLNQQLAVTQRNSADWKGKPTVVSDPNIAVIADDAKLDSMPLALLEAEIARIEKLVSVDRDTTSKFVAVSKKITEENAALARLNEKLVDCEGAKARIKSLVQEREAAYRRVFDAIVGEQTVLSELYSPLMKRLETAQGSLRKLSISVRRVADVYRWAKEGESLLDLRQKGPFKGQGTLQQLAEAELKSAWQTGDSAVASAAMAEFLAQNRDAILERSPVPRSNQADYRAWSKQFAKWLYSTDHITIQYSIDYDGTDIRKLSPGTRGIVLLLLYLALDDADDRPLIIDQPEENLDPKSVFDELVGLFLEAKSKRQVIMVTHNANLVVNTDADQIIIAQAGPHAAGELPPITYTSGGLETLAIRTAVCDTLEGGEQAFQERARRLRVQLER